MSTKKLVFAMMFDVVPYAKKSVILSTDILYRNDGLASLI